MTGIAAGTIMPAGKAKVSSNGVVSLKLVCKGPSEAMCEGTLTLSIRRTPQVKRKGHAKPITKTVKVGSTSYLLTVPKLKQTAVVFVETVRSTVTVKFGKAILKQLDAAKEHKVNATATLNPASGSSSAKTVTLVREHTKTHHKKR